MMKDLSSLSSRSKWPKLKLIVSFNGTFCRRPPSRKFRYTGGETRIISVDRNISFSKLKSKITDLIRPNGGLTQFSLKYHISESSSSGGNGDEDSQPLLILLQSDDDVRCMVEEYELVELKGKSLSRLWVFVCTNINDRFGDNGLVNKHVLSVKGDRSCEGKKGFVENTYMREDEGVLLGGEDLVVHLLGTTASSNKNSSCKKFNDHYSLRKMVLRQQLLSKKIDEIRCVVEQSEMELITENEDCGTPCTESCPEPESPLSVESKTVHFGGALCRKVTDYKYVNAHRKTNANFGQIFPITESNCGPLFPKDGNLGPGSAVYKGDFSGQSRNGSSCSLDSLSQFVAAGQPPMLSHCSGASSVVNCLYANRDFRSFNSVTLSEMNRESIMPWGGNNMISNGFFPRAGHDLLTGGAYPLRSSQACERGQEGYPGGIRNHRFGLSEPRRERNCPYHIRSRSLVTEIGNNRNFRLDGRPWVGKFYPRLRSSSNISKPGPNSRSYIDASSKPFFGSRFHKVEEEDGTMDYGHNNRSKIFNLPSSGQEIMIKTGVCRLLKHERGSAVEGFIDYDGAFTGASHKFSLPIDVAASSLPNARAMDTQMDLLTGPGSEKYDIACQALSAEALDKVGMNAEALFDINTGVHLWNREEVIISASPYSLSYSSGTELSCNNKLLDTESGCGCNIYQKCAQALDGHTASAVDLSLHNLTLASSRMLQLPSSSSAGVEKSESLLKLQSKDLDLIDEEHLNSGPILEKSSDTTSNSSPDEAARRGNDDNGKQQIQQNPGTNLSTEEKDEKKRTNKCLKVGGDFPANIAAFYTHLATRELQNINNSDLECIKELGSGTFGTVYYGKWKGSDVAIKRIKPSCFTDGAKEEDRLVADFWKEAHILGQLHHPNIVALYGVVTDGPVNSLATVTEYMVNGSLKQVLRRKDRTIDRRKRLIIAMDAAFGMEYLHKKNIVHFDLKSHNFLMNTRDPQRPICKIGDLGLSKVKQRTLVSGGVRGTIPWMAPELLRGKNLVSEKVDVYSFAIVMWELLSGEEPYADMRSEEIIAGMIRGNLRPEIPSWCDPAWRSLMERCWSSDPDSRPSFSEIAKELRAMAAAMNIK